MIFNIFLSPNVDVELDTFQRILTSGHVLVRLFLLGLVLSLLVYGWFLQPGSQAAAMFSYYSAHILTPLLLVIVIQLLCSIYSVLAWTRTSLRSH